MGITPSEKTRLTYPDKIFIFGVFTLSASIPVSKFTTSLSILLMAFAWFLQWNWKEKLNVLLKSKKEFLITTSLFYIFVIGLLYSSDLEYALKDLKIKLPLFALPVLLLTGVKLSVTQVKITLALISASAITASLIGFINYQIKLNTAEEFLDLRLMSPFISHIRLTLILCFSVAYSLWIISNSKSRIKWLLLIPILWVFYFVNLMGSLTGTVILPIVILLFLVVHLYNKHKVGTIIGLFILLMITIVSVLHISDIYQTVFSNKTYKSANKTINGNQYFHDSTRTDSENGFKTWEYVCEKELELEWNKKSKIKYKDQLNGYPFSDVLIRYLTSLGLKKDSVGVNSLGVKDINAIEKGIANQFYINHNELSNRIHVTFWELKNLSDKDYSNASSITMRFEYWKIAFNIFKNNPIIGVGTGDIQNEFKKSYAKMQSTLDTKYQRRSHNQYLTILATLGIIGLICFLTAFLYPLIQYQGELKFIFLVFAVIILASMLWEDTIESQAGATIFALFNSLFLFSSRNYK